MFYLACFILGFTFLQFLVALANVIFESNLPHCPDLSDELISILIPARNEENNIGNLLNDLKELNYKNIEIIVFNDLSDDRTAEIVKEHSLNDSRISLIESKGLPEGWLGKNFACHSLSEKAKGKFYLFLDADVRIGGDILSSSIAYSQKYQLSLFSIFPEQIIITIGEKATIPIMNYILLSLLPLILVRKSGFKSFSAANGQFMFFEAEKYKLFLPHQVMKNNKVEDIAIARYYKEKHCNVACLVGNETIQCRMYTNFREAVNGFSKNVISFFGNSFITAILFWLVVSFGFIIVLLTLPVFAVIIYVSVYLVTRIMISYVSKQKVLDNLLYLIPQLLSCGLFIYYAFLNSFIRKFQWKGRFIHSY